jgi:hypothetical protein
MIGFYTQQAQLQQQQQQQQQPAPAALQLLMQQPAAMQMLLQQPALLGPAAILLRGQMMSPATQVPQVPYPAAASSLVAGPGNAAAALMACAMPPAAANPVTGSRVVLPHAEPLQLAGVTLTGPIMQQLLQQHQDLLPLIRILASANPHQGP